MYYARKCELVKCLKYYLLCEEILFTWIICEVRVKSVCIGDSERAQWSQLHIVLRNGRVSFFYYLSEESHERDQSSHVVFINGLGRRNGLGRGCCMLYDHWPPQKLPGEGSRMRRISGQPWAWAMTNETSGSFDSHIVLNNKAAFPTSCMTVTCVLYGRWIMI